MKRNINSAQIVNIAAAIVILILVSVLLMMIPRSQKLSVEGGVKSFYFEGESADIPIDPTISGNLPHNTYIRLRDSIQLSRRMQNGMETASSRFAMIGLQVNNRCDNCTAKDLYENKKPIKEYLLHLHWWTLDTGAIIQPTLYFVKHGQSYLRKTICRQFPKIKGRAVESYNCKQVITAVPFRCDTQSKNILIPVSKGFYKIMQPALLIVAALFMIFFIYILAGDFLKFLLDIAAGKAFSKANVKRMRRIAIILFVYPTLFFGFNLLMPLLYRHYFTADIELNSDAWQFAWKPLLLSLIFAMLFIAFKKGSEIQQDNEGVHSANDKADRDQPSSHQQAEDSESPADRPGDLQHNAD